VSYMSIKPLTTLSPFFRLPGGEDQGGDGQPQQGCRGEGLPPIPDQD
jgi:hypothetical protein